MALLASLSQDIAQPEYLHVLLNPLPIYGLLMGWLGLGLALAFFRQSQTARITALVLVGIGAVSLSPVMHYGEAGYDRVLSMSDTAGGEWLKAHAHRADRVEPFYYALAALALAAIVMPRKWPHTALPLALAVFILGLGCLGGGAWIGYAGGRIRHKEFRNEPPPVTAADADHD